MAELKAIFGAMVRRRRTEKGLSQVELAQLCGRSLETVARIERGQSAPSFETVEAIAAALDVPAPALFGVGMLTEADERLASLVAKLAVLSPVDLAWLDRLISDALSRPR